MTDVNGQVNFITIYPGWYGGRTTHIHFQVFLNSILSATSQMAFPDSLNDTINNSGVYAAHGSNPTTNSNDNVFSDAQNTQYELVNISANGSGGYDASLVIGINAPVTGVIQLEPETGGQFKLKRNYPNPFHDSTVIPFRLMHAAHVRIELFDRAGRRQAVLIDENMQAGEQEVVLDRRKITLAAGTYVYQVTVENENGRFFQCKSLSVY